MSDDREKFRVFLEAMEFQDIEGILDSDIEHIKVLGETSKGLILKLKEDLAEWRWVYEGLNK